MEEYIIFILAHMNFLLSLLTLSFLFLSQQGQLGIISDSISKFHAYCLTSGYFTHGIK